MKKNMGSVDRIMRIALAVFLGGLYYAEVISGIWGILALVLAGIFVATSFISFCPLYYPFGISTCKTEKK